MLKLNPIIAIPARNEEDRLPALFAALAAQCWQERQGQILPVVVVLNNCTDGSRDAVLRAMATHKTLAIDLIDVQFEADAAHVGSARRLAMESAFASTSNPAHTVILTTDADSAPLPDWVSNNLRHISEGIDLVCGTVWLDKTEYEQLDIKFTERTKIDQHYHRAVDRLASLLDPQPHNPWPRHNDHCGASIAVRADVYRAVGGLPAQPRGEDYMLIEHVRQAGYLVRHPMDVVVETSARLVGRAVGGMAESLRNCLREATQEEPLLVEHPTFTWRRLEAKQLIAENDSVERIPAEDAVIMLDQMIADAERRAA